MKTTIWKGSPVLLAVLLCAPAVQSQTPQAIERRAERNAAQALRQATRADYYSNQAWGDLTPWLQRYGIGPVAAAVDAAATGAPVAAVDTPLASAPAVVGTEAVAVTPAVVPAEARYVYRDYGYRETAPAAGAFIYDYYRYTPTYYYRVPDADRYAGAVRYYDADNDGIYDYQLYYRDRDNDGVYDEYDRIDFYGGAGASAVTISETDPSIGMTDARRYRADGEVKLTKTAEVNGREHLLAGVDYHGEMLAVDLGPLPAAETLRVAVGQRLAAAGPVDRIGDKRVLFADVVRIGNGPEISLSRPAGIVLTGRLVDITTTPVGTGKHYIAVIEADDQRQLVDLGPSAAYQVQLQPSSQVVIRGVPVMANRHRVIMADEIDFNGQVIRIDRSQIAF